MKLWRWTIRWQCGESRNSKDFIAPTAADALAMWNAVSEPTGYLGLYFGTHIVDFQCAEVNDPKLEAVSNG